MATIRDIRKRMKAVGNIKRITRTMQMIATSKFSKAQARTVASQPFSQTLFDLIAELAQAGDQLEHPILSGDNGASDDARDVTLVLTSDRGLCGAYNGQILREATAYFRDRGADPGRIEVVGKKGNAFLKFAGIEVGAHHTQFGDDPRYEEVARLAQSYIDEYMGGQIRSLRVCYMHFVSTARQTPEIVQILPFEHKQSEGEPGAPQLYEFSPDAGELLADLLPSAIKALLFQAFLEANLSEHVARMIAMKAATDNAGKMGKTLNRQYNRARQAQITTELTEIISGAAALE